jgi:hypothetical protein
MGIMSFLKNAGQKLTPRTEDAPPPEPGRSEQEMADLAFQNRLTRFVHEMQVPIQGLRIEFRNGKATLYGEAESQAIRENTRIAIGNTQGVESVDDRMTVKKPAPESTFYTVKSGDTLSKIAEDHYGAASRYPEIFEANRPMLEHPDRIYPGQVLRIPPETS